MANQMVGLGGQLEVEREREEGGLFKGFGQKECREEKKGGKRLYRGNTVGEFRSLFSGIPVVRCPPLPRFAKYFGMGLWNTYFPKL